MCRRVGAGPSGLCAAEAAATKIRDVPCCCIVPLLPGFSLSTVGYPRYKCADKYSFVPNCPKLIFSFVPKRAPKLGFLSFVPFQKPKNSVASGTALERL